MNEEWLRCHITAYADDAFTCYHFDGILPFRAMNLKLGFSIEQTVNTELKNVNLDDNPYQKAISKEIKDQYMTGEHLLVAPMFAEQKVNLGSRHYGKIDGDCRLYGDDG